MASGHCEKGATTVVVRLVHNCAGFSVASQIFTAFRTEYRVFQAIFPGKSGQL
jgi:hypothetical protein